MQDCEFLNLAPRKSDWSPRWSGTFAGSRWSPSEPRCATLSHVLSNWERWVGIGVHYGRNTTEVRASIGGGSGRTRCPSCKYCASAVALPQASKSKTAVGGCRNYRRKCSTRTGCESAGRRGNARIFRKPASSAVEDRDCAAGEGSRGKSSDEGCSSTRIEHGESGPVQRFIRKSLPAKHVPTLQVVAISTRRAGQHRKKPYPFEVTPRP